MKLYLLSGLGADYRVFRRLKIQGVTTQLIEWIQPKKNESLESYTQRLLPQIQEETPIHLLGVSFGGIIAQELAKIKSCKSLTIISSVKSKEEYSLPLKIVRKIRIDKIVPISVLKWLGKISGPFFFGVSAKEEKIMLRGIMDDTEKEFLKWAIDKILTWEGNNHQRIYHIHGSADRIFPVRRLLNYQSIEKGGHLMIYNRAEEINRLVESEIKKGE